MSAITIEGTVTPSTFLASKERRTVERTEFIDKLIRKGYVKVVPTPDTVKVAATPVEPDEVELPAVTGPPKNASRDEWAAWLDEAGIEYTDEDGRDALIALWDESNG